MSTKREETNSVTYLVKLIAEEVFEELSTADYNRLSARIELLENRPVITVDGTTFLKTIQSNLKKAGEYWSKDEDSLLIDEVKTALATIAQNHRRSKGAIVARILQKELIKKEQ